MAAFFNKIGMTRNRLRALLLVLLVLPLTACEFKMTSMSLSGSDTLEDVTGTVIKARGDYLKQATSYLNERGVAVVFDSNVVREVEDGTTLENVNWDKLYEDGAAMAELSDLSKSILMSSFSGTPIQESGKFTADITDDGNTVTKNFNYEFGYGYPYRYWDSNGDGKADEKVSIFEDGGGTKCWYLHLEGTENYPELSADLVASSMGVSYSGSGTGWFEIEWDNNNPDKTSPDKARRFLVVFDVAESLVNVSDTPLWDGKWHVEPSDANIDLKPDSDCFGAFGTGSINTLAQSMASGGRNTFSALVGMDFTSTAMSPSNYFIEGAGQKGSWTSFGLDDFYIRKGTFDGDIANYDVTSWDGKGGNKIPWGFEALSSSVVDYGHIMVLNYETSAKDIQDTQRKLYEFFGNGSTTITSGSVSGNGISVDGSGVISAFRETEVCVVPPGFGVLCYSMIPREGITDFSGSLGTIVPVVDGNGSGNALALGFIGPNPYVLDAMDRVLGCASGGFAIINEHIYLMAYPVSVINYLYTENDDTDGEDKVYIGVGAAPIYYNLIYDRLDYKFGDSYQFQTTASTGVSDPLYQDYNFVGGICSKDVSGVTSGDGGIYLLQTDEGKNALCNVSLAARENVTEARKRFEEMVNTYYVRPVPLADATTNIGHETAEARLKDGVLALGADGQPYFTPSGDGTKMDAYLDDWEKTLHLSVLTVPQFILMDYVETTLLPGAAGDSDAAVTGRKIRLSPAAILYDGERHLPYIKGDTSIKIGEYRRIDGTPMSGDAVDVRLGDIVDIRALSGVGYSKRTGVYESVQPPYGYNMLFPIGTKIEDYDEYYTVYAGFVDKYAGNTLVSEWVDDYAQSVVQSNAGAYETFDMNKFGSMSYWDGRSGGLADSEYYQTVSAVNNVAVLTQQVEDGNGDNVDVTSVVAMLNVSGAELAPHLGVTDVTKDTRIDELPYVPTNIITFSEPFPNTMFLEDDANGLYAVSESAEGAIVPNVMYTIGVGSGVTHGNFYHAWVTSEAPTDSLTWWNNYLEAHNFKYKLDNQTVEEYLETNYSYLANEDNRLRFDLNAAQYWSEELDTLNPKRGGNRVVRLLALASNVVGWAIIIYALICVLVWAVDIYGGLDKDFYRLLTGGRYVASAEPMPPSSKVHYATFLNALARSVILCVAGSVLIFVGASVILAKMFKFLALILRLVSGYWTGYNG